MKLSPIHVASLLLVSMLLPICRAQDKLKQEDKPRSEVSTTPVKVSVVFTEYEGDKKTKSLPYTLYVNAPDAAELKPQWVKLRVGNRVPVYTGGDKGSFTYLDVGTSIDSRAAHTPEGYFLLYLNLERSSAEGSTLAGSFQQPIIRSFKSELDLKLREAQVMESTMATDPISGKVLKVEVSLSVVK